MSKNGPRIGSAAQVNGLVWITSLRPDEQGVTTRILDDLGNFFKAINVQYFVHEPKTASQLINLLDEIAEGARLKGFKPIIHFDTHGGKDTGLHITASHENVPWEAVCGFRFKSAGYSEAKPAGDSDLKPACDSEMKPAP